MAIAWQICDSQIFYLGWGNRCKIYIIRCLQNFSGNRSKLLIYTDIFLRISNEQCNDKCFEWRNFRLFANFLKICGLSFRHIYIYIYIYIYLPSQKFMLAKITEWTVRESLFMQRNNLSRFFVTQALSTIFIKIFRIILLSASS